MNIIQGDIFKAYKNYDGIPVLAHGVNCRGVFAAGIAKQIAEKYPKVKEEYIKKYNNSGWNLGEIQPVRVDEGYIVNCATQENFGSDGKKYVDDLAVYTCMFSLYNFVEGVGDYIVPMIPQIGCGLGGGEWEKISYIIKTVFHDRKIDVYHL